MRKSDKGKKVFGAIVILAIIVSVFGGVVSAEGVSGGLKQSVDVAQLFDKNKITDQQKQQEILNMVNSHRGSLPAELILAIIRSEGGEGAFYVDGWNYNYFYRESDGPWAQPTNGDGIMQVTTASGYHERSGPYTHDWAGYDHAINDGCDYLLALYNTYGTHVQSTLHYNTGPNSLYIYLGKNWGDRDYLSHVAGHLSNFVPKTYALQNQNLVNVLNQGQNILNKYLYDMDIAIGQSVGYYEPYQTQLDSDLHNILVTSLIPLTGDMYGNGKDITGFYNANTAEFTFGGETARFGRMADKTIMSESGTDTTGAYYAGKLKFIFDKRTEDTANIEFANQSAELGVVGSRGLSFGTQVGEYNGVIAKSNEENGYYSGVENCVDGYNTGIKWQCVEYVNRYYYIIYGMQIRLPKPDHAKYFYDKAAERGLIAHPNGGTTSPQPGDILCSNGGEYGHVAIVREVTTGSLHVIHQNWANTRADNDKDISMSISGGQYTVNRFNVDYPVQGWLRKSSESTQIPLTGDMYGSGTDTTGIYNTGTAEFTIGGKTVRFGQTNDEPIIGDWDGDGYDEIGLFRSSTSMFYLVTRNWATLPYDVGAADKDIPFSYPEDIPIAGDWDGDGDDDIGGYYPITFYLYLLNLGSSTATSYRDVPFGKSGDIPLIGDWDNDGDDDVAVCRKHDINNNPTYYFDLDLTGGEDYEIGPYEWGNDEDIPIAGRWNAGSGDKIGVYRPSTEEFHFSYDIPQIQECDGTDTSCGIHPNCENCNDLDGCYPYGNSCEEREYYCKSNEEGCDYTYSNRHTDEWVDTGNTRWVDDPENECKEKEQKEQEYHDYTCSDGTCTYSVTDTQWIDTGNTRNKDDGTICGCTASNTLKRCYGGVCTDTGICDSGICGADAACDGKRPGDSCGGGICDSTCKCGGQAEGEDYGVFSAPLWFVDKNGDQLADDVFGYGFAGATPLVGDFNQDGSDDIAVVDLPWWFVDTNGDLIADETFGYGFAGGTPLVGDFNQDGKDDIAVVSLPIWFVDTDRDQVADDVFGYGFAGATPMVGDFNQDGSDDIAVVALPWWFVDTDRDQVADDTFGYGFAGATPIVGDIG